MVWWKGKTAKLDRNYDDVEASSGALLIASTVNVTGKTEKKYDREGEAP